MLRAKLQPVPPCLHAPHAAALDRSVPAPAVEPSNNAPVPVEERRLAHVREDQEAVANRALQSEPGEPPALMSLQAVACEGPRSG